METYDTNIINDHFSEIAKTDKLILSLWHKAVDIVMDAESASIPLLQRELGVGYYRAARLIKQMQLFKIISTEEGGQPSSIIMSRETYEAIFGNIPAIETHKTEVMNKFLDEMKALHARRETARNE